MDMSTSITVPFIRERTKLSCAPSLVRKIGIYFPPTVNETCEVTTNTFCQQPIPVKLSLFVSLPECGDDEALKVKLTARDLKR
jgi:hypothetical protein